MARAGNAVLEVDIDHRFGSFRLQANFQAQSGVTALFGRSGAGKSTLVAMVAGLVRPDAGKIRLGARQLYDSAAGTNLPAAARRVAVVFQEPRLFPHLSVWRNLTYGRWAGRRSGHQDPDAIIELLGLEALLERSPDNLSGGEAQRVSIGRALLADPDILLMDEPLSQLDGARRAEILPWLDRLAHEVGVPILYVSHALDEVARLADSLVVLSDGKVVASGAVEDVMRRIDLGPATGRYEAGSLLHGTIDSHDPDYRLSRISVGGDHVEVPAIDGAAGDPVRLRIRARDVALSLAPVTGSSIRNCLSATIVEIVEEDGAFAEILLNLGEQAGTGSADDLPYLRARLTRKSVAELKLRLGDRIFALVKAVAVDRQSGR